MDAILRGILSYGVPVMLLGCLWLLMVHAPRVARDRKERILRDLPPLCVHLESGLGQGKVVRDYSVHGDFIITEDDTQIPLHKCRILGEEGGE